MAQVEERVGPSALLQHVVGLLLPVAEEPLPRDEPRGVDVEEGAPLVGGRLRLLVEPRGELVEDGGLPGARFADEDDGLRVLRRHAGEEVVHHRVHLPGAGELPPLGQLVERHAEARGGGRGGALLLLPGELLVVVLVVDLARGRGVEVVLLARALLRRRGEVVGERRGALVLLQLAALELGQGRRGRLHQELAEAVVAVGAEPEALVVAQREEVLEEGGRGPLEQVVARGEPHAQVEGERADLHEGLVRGRHHQRQAHRRPLGAGRVPHGDRVDVDGLQLRPRGPRVLVDVPRVGAGDPVVDGEGEVLLGGLERGGVVGEVRQVERGVGDAAARVQRDEALDAEFHGAGGGRRRVVHVRGARGGDFLEGAQRRVAPESRRTRGWTSPSFSTSAESARSAAGVSRRSGMRARARKASRRSGWSSGRASAIASMASARSAADSA